ncbi:MAG: hypothetical protein AAFX92_10305 [Pseudomonadota bacterium]
MTWAMLARRALAIALRPFRPPLSVAPKPDEQILPIFANASSVSRPAPGVVGMDLTGVLADGGQWQLTERLCHNPADGQLHIQIVFAPK